ncbi:MAG TPA: Uma2 family endonuclease [Planctomycetota bacterium]|nr:Uma2 family endonuclease [Planctomycetota bacterium]
MLRCSMGTIPTMTTTARRRQRRWTYADYCRIPPDRNRHELIDGRHFVSPAPGPYHQTVSRRLQYELMRLIEKPGLGEVFDAPIDVHLGRGTLVQPAATACTCARSAASRSTCRKCGDAAPGRARSRRVHQFRGSGFCPSPA